MLAYTHSRLIAFIGVNFVILFSYLPFMSFYGPAMKPVAPFFTISMQILISAFAMMVEITFFFAVFTEPEYLNPYQRLFTPEQEIKQIKEETKNAKEKIIELRRKVKNAKFNSGDVENNYNIDVTALEKEINNLYLQQLNKKTYCFTCDLVKPIRAHHCKTCKKCVLRMDHHCPWTGNCVGADNIRYFIQFLFYASFALFILFGIALAFYCFSASNPDSVVDIAIKANCIFSIIIGAAIGYLFIYQIKNARINLTTVEDNIEGASSIKPFDKGLVTNLEEVFGAGLKLKYVFLPFDIPESNKQMVSN